MKKKNKKKKQRDNSETLEVLMRKAEAGLAGFKVQSSHDLDVREEINFDFYLESDVPLPRRPRQHVAFEEFLEDASEEADKVHDCDDETDSDFESFECHYRRDHGDAAFEELMNDFCT